MKQLKLTILLAVLMSMVGVRASAYDFAVKNGDGITIYYNKISDTKVAVTNGGSSSSSYSNKYTGNVIIPESVTYNGTTYSVTSIGYRAFDGCSGLTSVSIGNSVTRIDNWAFFYCTGLTSITIPNSVTSIGDHAFSWCRGLTSVSIGNSVTSIDGWAFEGCSGLTSVSIPNSVTSIGDGAFLQCSGLTSITIGNGVTSIGDGAFTDCTGLTSITIPNSVTSIGDGAFLWCKSLTSITVESRNPKYDSRNNCNAIIATESNTLITGCKNTTIPNSITSIGDKAFYGCTGLTSITIPNSVTSIGGSAFCDCIGLTSITIGNGVTSIGGAAFSGCRALISVTIGNGVTSIGDGAFWGCNNLILVNRVIPDVAAWCVNDPIEYGDTSSNPQLYASELHLYNDANEEIKDLVIPDGVESIRNSAFSACRGLKTVSIPNSVTSIGENAFSGCSSLVSIIMGDAINSIKSYAFANCTSLADVYCYSKRINFTSPYAFSGSGVGRATLHVPESSINIYKISAVWSRFKNIVPLTDSDPQPTGIINVNRDTTTDNRYYTLDGREVEHPTKGIYILNGKKVVVK